MSKVLEFHDQGYNCAESIIKTVNEEKGLNIPVALGTPFGTGMSTGNTCGAIVSALMVIGAEKGRESSDEKNNARIVTKQLVDAVIEKYGTIKCIDLKKSGVSCDDIIEFAYDKVTELV
ncbi:C-GCAxxG-C-C family (seleno)protein [uncultured Clostridium sp.]|uniref:C-GCAxxG-C-C family (seleno)protein n=1 Tax=uncultured Clostridium sp. TaxID=59620 RepID=UPI002613FDCB|nr:C-GCAxxG-C-C family (seleno)protein [uncultured Clostridium sp.]